MKKFNLMLALAIGSLLIFDASAGDRMGRPEPPSFGTIDSNSDQLISREEMAAALQAKARSHGPRGGADPDERFDRADEDGDGYINEAEFAAAREAMKERRERHSRRGDCDQESPES